MLKNKTYRKKYFLLVFSLLILPSIFAINNIVPLKFANEDENADEFIEEEGLYEEEIIDLDDMIPNPNLDPGNRLLDITEEEIVESTYDREAIDWRPIEDTLKNVQIKNEAEGGTIATVSYDTLTGKETLETPQFTPTPETATASGVRVVEPYEGLLPVETKPKTEDVIGGDGRVVYNNLGMPGRTVVKLYISASWTTGGWIGSGVIIDNFHVLTAGHCAYIYDDDTGNEGWASSIEVVPGMDLADSVPDPYGNAWVVGMRSYNGWTEDENYEHDWAMLTLDRNVGAYTGWMGRITAPSSSSIYDNTMNVAGYPGDLPVGNEGSRQYWDSASGDGATSNNHMYWADTAGGMSGGPVWRYADGNRHIMTIHAYGRDGADSNFGTRLNNNKFDRIFTWLGQDSAPTDKPDLVDRGAAYSSRSFTAPLTAGITTLSVSNGIRNKGTAWSGSFTVHYYASTNDYISTGDYLLGSDTVSAIAPFGTGSASWSGVVPIAIPEGDYYIGWIIDQNDVIDEFDENNNRAWEVTEHIDGSPPPISYIEVRVRKYVATRPGVVVRLTPIAGAYVRVIKYGFFVVDTGYTDDLGFYNVTGLSHGDYTVEVSKNGYFDETKVNTIHQSVILSQGYDDDYLYFYLKEKPFDSGYIEVTVKDSTTLNTLSNAKVELLNFTTGEVLSYGYTNSIGEFTITGLWIGWYEVRVSRYGYKTETRFDYINWNGDDDYLTFYMDEMPFDSGYIEVRVYNGTGAPVENAVVNTYNETSGLLIDTGYTDVNGTYNVTGLTIGWYSVNVSMLTFYGKEKLDYINWFGDDDYLTFYLTTLPPNSGFIDVYLYDNITLTPLVSAFIQTINQSSGEVIDSGYTDINGYYMVENLTIGWYEVNVTKVGYESPESQLVQINYFGDGDELEFYLLEKPPDSGYIEVEVFDDDTTLPLVNVTVDCYYLNGTLFDSGYTDTNGFYSITGLIVGWYKVEVSILEYTGQSSYDYINWNGDDDYLTFNLVKSPPGYIIVQVFDQYSYNPIDNAYVKCFNATSGQLFHSGYADSSGYYNVSGLLPGWWTIEASHVAFNAKNTTEHIKWLGDIAYLNFSLAIKYEPITGPVAIFRDFIAWRNLANQNNATELILSNYSIPYTIFNSSDVGVVDISHFQKVVIESAQPQSFYYAIGNNTAWFENYASGGGILEIHACDTQTPGWQNGDWNSIFLMPGSINKTSEPFVFIDLAANMSSHPILLNPIRMEGEELDSYIRGSFIQYPTSTTVILSEPTSSNPVLIESSYGSGFIIASTHALEFNQHYNYSNLLVNLLLYNPEFYNPTLNVTEPTSSNLGEISDPLHIAWTTTGSTSNIRMELFRDGVGVTTITPNTPNDGDYSWAIPPKPNSTQYQVKIFDADWPTVYAISDFFEIRDPRTITITSPSTGSPWTKGSTYTIEWNSTGTIADITIDLYASGSLVLDVSNGTIPNNGSFIWTIPSPLHNLTDHIIRISDAIDAGMYDDSGVFTIKDPSSGIPGYDLLILCGFLVGVSLIIIRRKRKNLNIHGN